MSTCSDDTQRIFDAALAAVPASPASPAPAEGTIGQFCGSIMDDMRRRRRFGKSGWAR